MSSSQDDSYSSSSSEDSSLPRLPSQVALNRPLTVTSSCSDSSMESSVFSFSSSSSTSVLSVDDDTATTMDELSTGFTQLLVDEQHEQQSSTVTRLSLMLDEVRELARKGHNATLVSQYTLPKHISKSDIHVQVDMDERASSQRVSYAQQHMEENILDAIRDDLQTVYSATADTAKLVLCIVVVVMGDGSISRSMMGAEGVVGLAEIGMVYRLFDADDLKIYDGGLVVQTEDVGFNLLELFHNRGKCCLLEKLVPRVANAVMSRIGDANEQLLVEI